MNTITPITTATVPPEPTTGPVRCASWCEDGDGHPLARFAADQWCRSIEGKIVTSHHEPWKMSDGTTTPAYARVYVAQDPGQRPRVDLVDYDDRGMELTPAEARDLAGMLVHMAWVAEQDEQQRNAFELGVDHGRMSPQT